MGPNLPGMVPVYSTYPSIIMNSSPSCSQKDSCLNSKLREHPQEHTVPKGQLYLFKYDGTHMDFCQPAATRLQMNSEARILLACFKGMAACGVLVRAPNRTGG